DFYFSIGAGISALTGPLHGGANEQVLYTLQEIGGPEHVKDWVREAIAKKRKIMGMGHRVYKTYDPRARILGPLAGYIVKGNPEAERLYNTAKALEEEVVSTIGKEKKIFPNVDFYSGIVYKGLGIQPDMFTPMFAVSRVAGWTARVYEYVSNNRIFRPRAVYIGDFDKKYIPIEQRKEEGYQSKSIS
ncbi:MAG: citrate/2-methylcitrate synthase, partial [Nitrospirae bacterium]